MTENESSKDQQDNLNNNNDDVLVGVMVLTVLTNTWSEYHQSLSRVYISRTTVETLAEQHHGNTTEVSCVTAKSQSDAQSQTR